MNDYSALLGPNWKSTPTIERLIRTHVAEINKHMDSHVRPITYEEVTGDARHAAVPIMRALIATLRDLPDLDGMPGYMGGQYSRRNIEAFIDDILEGK